MSTRSRRNRHLLRLAVLGGVVLALALVARAALVRLLPLLVDPVALREYVRSFGVLAPLAFLVLQAVQIVVAPIPGGVTGLIGGYLFGAVYGTVLTAVGGAIGSYVVFRLSRHYGRPLVERYAREATVAEFDAVAGDHGEIVLFVAFLLPGFPDDALCFLGGLSDIDVRRLLAISVLGRLPTHFLTNLAGARLLALRYLEVAAILGGLALVSVLVYTRRQSLVDRVERLASR